MDHRFIVAIPDGHFYIYHRWTNEYVLYNQFSGDTHLLDQTSGELVIYLMGKPASVFTLLKSLSSTLKCPIDNELERYFDELVQKLQNQGILEIREHQEN